MGLTWLWVVMALGMALAQIDRGGSSLRGALEVLQRRQRGRTHGPLLPQPDYDALYEFVPPQGYPESDYPVDVEDMDEEPNPKYIVKYLDENERSPPEAYEYKLIKKKSSHLHDANPTRQESPFRERAHHSGNDKLRDLFMDKTEAEEKKEPEVTDKDAEYAILLGQLWSKYKYNKDHKNTIQTAPQGVVKLYKEKVVKKRYPDNWGPIAFKRKRSSDSESDRPILPKYDETKHESGSSGFNYNTYELNDDDKDDLREEYAIAFQPLDDDTLSDLADEDQYSYDNIEKRFPITKRSSGSYDLNPKQRTQNQNKREAMKSYRSSSGTDPRIIKDLSKIFGESEIDIIKNPVKRSSDNVEDHHEGKPPMVPLSHANHTQEKNYSSVFDDNSHEHHGHNIHHPGISGKEPEVSHQHDHDHHQDYEDTRNERVTEKPIILKKKSIDWSDYFGIDKRKPVAFGNDFTQDRLRKQYFDTFNKEVLYPVNSFRKHSYVKRNFGKTKPNEETEIQINKAQALPIRNDKRADGRYNNMDNINVNLENVEGLMGDERRLSINGLELDPNEEQETKERALSRLAAVYGLDKTLIRKDEKRSTSDDNDSKLENIDKKLKNMEGLIVDEALHHDSNGDELDSKEAQETKEKLLSRLAAAYSLEKMRKALKEFKQSLQTQKMEEIFEESPVTVTDEPKTKRVAIKKELQNNELPFSNQILERTDDFEDEQGAGHYLNGKVEEPFSEGYMGGSGRHRVPAVSTVSAAGSCPVLAKIVQRCRGVDLLAGDRGQLFLPLCSLHQICYLCGEAPPTTCDLVFLSEADTACERDMSCQRAARSALMALRELHDNLADELDGECELSPCLPATLKLNVGWQRAIQR